MSRALLLRDRMAKFSAQIATLRQEQKQLIKETIANCKHELLHIAEVRFHEGILFTDPPKRICTDCGLSEEGWGCGYKLLGKDVYSNIATINDVQWRELVTKFIGQNGDVTIYTN